MREGLKFQPCFPLNNAHIQTLLSSSPMRKKSTRYRCRSLLSVSKSIRLSGEQGIVLEAFITAAKNPSKHFIFIFHGWEGSADSSYSLDSARALYDAGYNCVRLNFRDHGDTHHLNREPFNSVRLAEVMDAIEAICNKYNAQSLAFVGFSLGGNFALRLSAEPRMQKLNLLKTLAICPPVNPLKSSAHIERGNPIYHHYFVHKWRRSLRKKYRYFPEIMHSHSDLHSRSLDKMNRVFVPLHTDYAEAGDYLLAYAINQATVDAIQSPTEILYAADDPIIAAEDFATLQPSSHVQFNRQEYGGHCGFIKNFYLESYLDDYLGYYFTF